jgi:PilZ domain
MQGNLFSEDSHPFPERRAASRYEFRADIEIECGSGKLWGRVRDISRTGMFIELPMLDDRRGRFAANLALNEPLRMECVVRRVVSGCGVGVTITIPEEEGQGRYEALLVALSLGCGPAAASVHPPPERDPQRPLVADAR